MNGCSHVPIKLYLKKHATGWNWLAGHHLSNADLEPPTLWPWVSTFPSDLVPYLQRKGSRDALWGVAKIQWRKYLGHMVGVLGHGQIGGVKEGSPSLLHCAAAPLLRSCLCARCLEP